MFNAIFHHHLGRVGDRQVTGSELVAFNVSANALAITVSNVVSLYRRDRAIDRAKLRQIEQEAEEALRYARGQALGNLARINIEEIAATQRYIDSLRLKDAALDYAMQTLEQLHRQLIENLKGFSHA